MKNLILLAVFIALSVMTGSAFADVIYDNGGPSQTDAWYSDSSYAVFRNADSFVLQNGSSTITDIHWWGVYGFSTPPQTDDFTINIFETAAVAPLPGNLLYTNQNGTVTRVDSGLNELEGNDDIYAYSVFIDALSLTADTTYWLEILNDTANSEAAWAWSTAALIGEHAGWEGEGWLFMPSELAFNLTNDGVPVPEPSTFLLLGGGLAGLAFYARRRRKE